jgi:hypothetical protein
MKEYIKYIPMGLFFAHSVKIIAVGASFQDAPILAITATFCAYLVSKEEQKALQKLSDKLVVLEQKTETTQSETEELRSHVSTLKLGQQVKSVARF